MFNSIRSKLMFSFILIFLVTVGLGAVSYFFAQDNMRLVDQAISKDFNGSIQISELAILAQKIRRYEKEYFMYIGNAEKQNKYEKEWNETFAKIKEKLTALRKNRGGIWSSADWLEFDKWEQSLKDYGAGFRQVVADVDAGVHTDTLAANSAVQDAKNKFRTLVNGTIDFANAKYEAAALARQEIKVKSKELNTILLAALAVSAALCLVLILVMPRAIVKPIRVLSDSASAMSKGELEKPVPTGVGIKDFSELAATLERMRISQKMLIQRMGNAAAKVVG